jgi:hypothetical protein
MACQLSGPQLLEWGRKILDLSRGKFGKDGRYANYGDLMEAEVPDPKERVKLETAMVVLSEVFGEGLTADDVRNAIRWRDGKGDPGSIEIQYNKSGKQKRAIHMAERRWGRVTETAAFLRLLG